MRILLNVTGFALLTLLAACAPNNQSVQILYPIAPDVSEAGCLAKASGIPSALVEFDVDATNALLRSPFVAQNNMEDDADLENYRLNSHDFVIDRAIITYEAAEPSLAAAVAGVERVQPMGQTLQAASEAGLWIDIIPSDVALSLKSAWSGQTEPQLIKALVRLEGKTLGGFSLSSNTLPAIVSVCGSCQFVCPAAEEPAWNCSPGQGHMTAANCAP